MDSRIAGYLSCSSGGAVQSGKVSLHGGGTRTSPAQSALDQDQEQEQEQDQDLSSMTTPSSGHPRSPRGWEHLPQKTLVPGVVHIGQLAASAASPLLFASASPQSLWVWLLSPACRAPRGVSGPSGPRARRTCTQPVPACLRGVFWVYPRVPWHVDRQTLRLF